MHHIQQLLEQTRQQPMRCIYRLICFECFKRMLPDSWAEVVSDPALDPPPNAWRVVEEFDAAGGMQAYSNRFAKLHVEVNVLSSSSPPPSPPPEVVFCLFSAPPPRSRLSTINFYFDIYLLKHTSSSCRDKLSSYNQLIFQSITRQPSHCPIETRN
mmetsp:Transcript_47459/g.109197  ORF Transcript_47459/g.109197 Transcript_47459/m.109197 type:complete len:156 (-) Transcript_47459:228-695(-)